MSYDQYREHSAWYSANPQRLADFYSSAIFTPTPTGHIWARETRERILVAVHMPLAADLAQVSADLLFSEPPEFTVPDNVAAQERLEELVEEAGIINRLLAAAETASAMGGVYMRPVWDTTLADHPILDIVQPDRAIPEFSWGMLRAVTFWRIVHEERGSHGDKDKVWRHLERHEIVNGSGVILHGLYKGTRDTLGVAQPLTSMAATAELKPVILTNMPGLDVQYVPNMLPNRLERGSSLGVSDYQGKESLLASLDEAWTSLIGELQLCKVRIFVPEEYIERINGTAAFNADTQIFVPLDIDPMSATNIDLKIQQPDIRVEKHLLLVNQLVTDIVSRTGYAPQTFGLQVDGNAPSGTALRMRERRSLTTLAKKQRYWKTPVQNILRSLLHLDKTVFGGSHDIPERVAAAFADSVAPDMTELATVVNLMKQAEAASEFTRIKTLHTDWKDSEVEKEQKRIQEDKEAGLQLMAAAMGDPTGGAMDKLDSPKGKASGEDEDEDEEDAEPAQSQRKAA